MKDLLVIVPTRSRPHNVEPVVQSWLDTQAFDHADLLFAYDLDDPAAEHYRDELQDAAQHVEDRIGRRILQYPLHQHQQLVPKLNRVATQYAMTSPAPFALGFAGDDHRPRTPGWAKRFVDELRQMKTGIVYPDDGYRQDIPTSWYMTSDIVRALGAMVSAPVEHLYCDDALRDLGRDAGCLRFMPDVLVEHLNPYAGEKAPMDEQYARVNARSQYVTDGRAYRRWRRFDLPRQAGVIRNLATGEMT